MTNQNGPSVSQKRKIEEIYDSLFDFESRNQRKSYPIHKNIEKSGKSLLGWIEDQVSITGSERILDAGCGTGNTLFRLHDQYGIKGIGLSISAKEIDFAKKYALSEGLQSALSFYQRDFSEPIEDLGDFDIIIAIESLKHNKNPFTLIQSLKDRLILNGVLIIADDFLEKEVSQRDIEKHKKSWFAPGFVSKSSLEKELTSHGISYDLLNLTRFVPLKKGWKQMLILKFIMVVKQFVKRFGRFFRNLETYEGAIILERLYQKGEVGYYLVVCKGGGKSGL